MKKAHPQIPMIDALAYDNQLSIIVPCHRIIASDGTLGGLQQWTSNQNLVTDS